MKVLFYLILFSLNALAESPSLTKVASLNKVEPYTPQVFHHGYLWLGKLDYSTGVDLHFLEVRDKSGLHVIQKITPPHSVIALYPFDENRVLFTGKKYTEEGWRTYYSLAKYQNGQVTLETHLLPLQFQIEEFAGAPGRLFFNMVSDRTLVEVRSGKMQILPLSISGPGVMFQQNNALFVLERRDRHLGDENVVRIDLKTQKTERVFSKLRNGLLSIIPLLGGKYIAASETLAHQVLLIDADTLELKAEISLGNTYPYGLIEMGHCLVVGSASPPQLTLIDPTHLKSPIVDSLSLEAIQNELPNVAKMALDKDTGRLFLRSIGINTADSTETNSVYSYINEDWIKKCQVPF